MKWSSDNRVVRFAGGGDDIFTVLDIGTSNITCIIASPVPEAPGRMRLLGMGVRKSDGIKAGVVTDMAAAEKAVRAAVDQAEQAAELTVERVVVSVACGRISSETFRAKADVESGRVTADDMKRVVRAGRSYAERDGRQVVLMNDLGCMLDGAGGIRNPIGMSGALLEMDLHAVTADEPPIKNLRQLISRCYLTVARLVVAPLASGLAVTTPEERQLGVAVITIGGGTTTISGFVQERLVFCDALAMGGNHVSYDIARQLSCSLEEAERIKTLHGTLIGKSSTAHETVSYLSTLDGGLETRHVAHGRIIEAIQPRYGEILKHAMAQIQRSDFAHLIARQLVLTGGGSQALCLDHFAANALSTRVRCATPGPIDGMPDAMATAGSATALGMLKTLPLDSVAATAAAEVDDEVSQTPTYLRRVGRWLRDGF